MSIYSKVASFLTAYAKSTDEDRLIGRNMPLVLGVSGGPDSLTLLHLLVQRKLYDRSMVIVAHLNHKLRPTAERDATYVRKLAFDWGLDHREAEIDVAAFARDEGLGIEHAARVARYRFLATVADEVGAKIILTAHTADDQAETILMNLLRGTGLTGLRGILPMAPNPEAPHIKILRPMLDIWREEVEAYCIKYELNPVIDPTNLDTHYFRNRVRNSLIPYLQKSSPDLKQNLHNLATLVHAEYELVQNQLLEVWPDVVALDEGKVIKLDLERWRSNPLGLRRYLIRQAWSKLVSGDKELGFQALELARQMAESGSTGAKVDLPAEVVMSVDYDHLVFRVSSVGSKLTPFPQLPEVDSIPLDVPGEVILNGDWRVRAQLLTDFDYAVIVNNPDPWTAFLCGDQSGDLFLRIRVFGDRLFPLGMARKSKKVSELMIDEKIPQRYRGRWPLLVNKSHFLWIPGHQLDERAQVTPDCNSVVQVRFSRDT